jgi:hypothetical protein
MGNATNSNQSVNFAQQPQGKLANTQDLLQNTYSVLTSFSGDSEFFTGDELIEIGQIDPFDETKARITQDRGINLLRPEIVTVNEFIPLGKNDNDNLETAAQLSVTFGGENNFEVTNAYRLMELNSILQGIIAESVNSVVTVDAGFGDPSQGGTNLNLVIAKVYNTIMSLDYEDSFRNIQNLDKIVEDIKEVLRGQASV